MAYSLRDKVLILITILLSLDAAFSFSANRPGVKIRITQKGLEEAGRIAMETIGGAVRETPIKDQSGSFGSKPRVHYGVYSVKITEFETPSIAVSSAPGQGLQMRSDGGRIQVEGNWKYNYRILFAKLHNLARLSFKATVSGINIDLVVNIDDDHGRPSMSVVSCGCNVARVDVKFYHGLSWLYNLLSPYVESMLKDQINDMVCKGAKKAINTQAAQLQGMELLVPIGGALRLDYSLVQSPVFGKSYLESYHKGEIFWTGDNRMSHLEPPIIPKTPVADRMLSIWISDFVMNTLGEAFQRHNSVQYYLTKQDLGPKSQDLLSTTCKLFCIGTSIPELKAKYPGADVSVSLVSTASPMLRVTHRAIAGVFTGMLTTYATLPGQNKQFIFNATMKLTLDMNLRIVKHNITTSVHNLRAKDINIISSSVDVTGSHVQWLFNNVLKGFMSDNMDLLGSDGFALPMIKGAKLVNPEIQLLQNIVLLMTDVSP